MKTKTIAIEKLNPAEYNPRTISDENLAALKVSIERFGLVEPIVWNESTGNVVGGHQRLKVLQEKGETKIDVVVVNLDEQEEKALNIALNSQYLQGTWDLPKLQFVLEEIQDFPQFDDLKFGELLGVNFPVDETSGGDEFAPAVQSETISRPGDVWLCGKHRVMCGDSTKDGEVATLLAECAPVLMVTDPPYGVEYDPEWRAGVDLGIGKRSKGKVENDDRVDWSDVWVLWNIPVIYCWHAGRHASSVQQSLESNDYRVIAQIIWAKQHFVISRGDYHWQHEPCWYAVKKNCKHNWQGARDQASLWEIKNNNSFGNSECEEKFGHGTQKPLECMARPIRNNSAVGDIVCDPFLGSGTTLIAAEQLGRVCYGMEISPAYCDMSVRRWRKATGKIATLESDGRAFEDAKVAV